MPFSHERNLCRLIKTMQLNNPMGDHLAIKGNCLNNQQITSHQLSQPLTSIHLSPYGWPRLLLTRFLCLTLSPCTVYRWHLWCTNWLTDMVNLKSQWCKPLCHAASHRKYCYHCQRSGLSQPLSCTSHWPPGTVKTTSWDQCLGLWAHLLACMSPEPQWLVPIQHCMGNAHADQATKCYLPRQGRSLGLWPCLHGQERDTVYR